MPRPLAGYNALMLSMRLTCHPSTPCKIIRRLEVNVHRTRNGMLTLRYALEFPTESDRERVRFPRLRAPRRADRLWQHTCFEAFLMKDGLPGYYELNFSPSSEWAVYRFEAYRQDISTVSGAMPSILWRETTQRLELEANIRLNGLSATFAEDNLRLALSAVIEDQEGRLSYWALVHPPGTPDFHHPDSFLLKLDQGDSL